MNSPVSNSESSLPTAPLPPESSSQKDAGRCSHRTPSGRRCRGEVSNAASGLCPRHNAAQKQRRSMDLAELLTLARETFVSAAGINHSLSRIFTLLAEDRVSPRRAAVLAYIGSLALRSLPAMEREMAGHAPPKLPPKIILDFSKPRPETEQQS